MNITFVSTVHKERGKCNADELYEILEQLKPEVIFLEAIEDTYSDYDKTLFYTWGVAHKKLEIAAIQKYNNNKTVEYVPVLDAELPTAFYEKYDIVTKQVALQKLLDECDYLVRNDGFKFLNSDDCMKRHEEMRELENRLLSNDELKLESDAGINAYEDAMIRNIYSYSKSNKFNTAVFMCGAAHRKSINDKIEKMKEKENANINWTFFNY